MLTFLPAWVAPRCFVGPWQDISLRLGNLKIDWASGGNPGPFAYVLSSNMDWISVTVAQRLRRLSDNSCLNTGTRTDFTVCGTGVAPTLPVGLWITATPSKGRQRLSMVRCRCATGNASRASVFYDRSPTSAS